MSVVYNTFSKMKVVILLNLLFVWSSFAQEEANLVKEITSSSRTDPATTPSPSTTPGYYLVSVVNSNVPSTDYEYDAVGILQVTLQETHNFTTALPIFLSQFQQKHDTHQWKLSSGCSTLLLPTGILYLELKEYVTNTIIYVFE
ncbi:uncharacterized protein LOC115889765 [Sitophilus oryzae]|uniref:Uncharacterized protein LOC115889765 n=1 Tax=Sitophilus oryzae TaxID=7048 RepID=A0A6J2YNZ8_SITOR|nr:uncharacterized protein LOC115889765 [Sitophilus oryzae]